MTLSQAYLPAYLALPYSVTALPSDTDSCRARKGRTNEGTEVGNTMHPFPLRSGCATDHQHQHQHMYLYLSHRSVVRKPNQNPKSKVETLDGQDGIGWDGMGCAFQYSMALPAQRCNLRLMFGIVSRACVTDGCACA